MVLIKIIDIAIINNATLLVDSNKRANLGFIKIMNNIVHLSLLILDWESLIR